MSERPDDASNTSRTSALFLLQLKEGKGLSQTAVNTVVEGCERLLDESLQRVRKGVIDKLQKAELSNIIPEIEEVFQSHPKPTPK